MGVLVGLCPLTKKSVPQITETHFLFTWRRVRDSNPRRCDPQRFSRPPHSTTLPTLRWQKYKLIPLLKTLANKYSHLIHTSLILSPINFKLFSPWLRTLRQIALSRFFPFPAETSTLLLFPETALLNS